MANKKVGIIKILIAAAIFGFTPLLTSFTYGMGNNGLNMAFFRNLICIPILFAVAKKNKLSFKLSGRNLFFTMIAAVLGSAATTVLLYSSYSYISSGIATILHFTYPSFIVLSTLFLFRNTISKQQVISVMISLVGLLCFVELNQEGKLFGFILAIGSGITYAFYILWLQKTRLVDVDSVVLSFYLAVFAAVYILLLNPFLDFVTFDLPLWVWIIIILVASLTSFVATILLQDGLKVVDGSTVSILGLIEPVIGFSLGIWLQGETLNWLKFLGFGLIIFSIVLSINLSKESIDWDDGCFLLWWIFLINKDRVLQTTS